MRQQPNETINEFLNRLQQAVQSCDYMSIQSCKVENAMVLQGLMLGIRDNKMCERLMTAENCLSIDSDSTIAPNCVTVARSLAQQSLSIISHLNTSITQKNRTITILNQPPNQVLAQ